MAQLLPGDHFAGMFQQSTENLEWLFAELNSGAIVVQFGGTCIKLKGAEPEVVGSKGHGYPLLSTKCISPEFYHRLQSLAI
jgi:hypothetical protein